MTDNPKSYLTPPEICKQLRVSSHKVLGWIRRGELRAVNVSDTGFRPRYRVSQQSLDEFLESREVQPPPPRVRRKRQPPEGGPLDPELGEQLMKKKQAVKVNGKYYRVWDGVILFF
ncbi:helix-turn-helix domain-containing protein [Aeoliella sp. SH292]|uniref:helix-turn-helix domain-containing protein n=1 Tax=Aeoliella sp. SH292 TaxID=3454464 RepID=UPI003F94D167